MSHVSRTIIGVGPTLEEAEGIVIALQKYDKITDRDNHRKRVLIEGGTKSRGCYMMGGNINYLDNKLLQKCLRDSVEYDKEYCYIFIHEEDKPAYILDW